MRAIALAWLVAAAGCTRVLGLDDTTFEQRDATVDAPSSCDGAPRCTSSTGRSACGQLFGTGELAGQLLRVTSPTGETCANLSSSEGPCAYTIYGQTATSFYAGNAAERIAGEIDDCGRFVVLDIDASAADAAVVVTGTDAIDSAAVVIGRDTLVGADTGITAPVVTTATATAWGTQISSTDPPQVTGAVLVSYVDAAGQPLASEELRVDGGGVNAPPAVPWGVYFTGTQPYDSIDPTLTTTQVSGAALVVPAAGSFQLGGFRPGKNCTPVTLQPVGTALIHVTLSC